MEIHLKQSRDIQPKFKTKKKVVKRRNLLNCKIMTKFAMNDQCKMKDTPDLIRRPLGIKSQERYHWTWKNVFV